MNDHPDQTPTDSRTLRRVLVTGLSGTLAPHLSKALQQRGAEIVAWDRRAVPPDDAARSAHHLEESAPDAICHLAMGAESWAAQLAAFARTRGIPFLFTSTAMVFHHEPDGPHKPLDERTARDDYGRYKIRCEDAILAANPGAIITRIGWQIDPASRGNNMIAQLDRQQAETGRIEASRTWIPACSYMADTAEACARLIDSRSSGAFHLDGNARDAWSFDRVVAHLKTRLAKDAWVIRENDSYHHDQRLIGNEDLMPRFSAS